MLKNGVPAQRVRAQRGFTLVELLVVIAIIATLISILLPGIQMARKAAGRAVCQSSMHQQGVAIASYTNINKKFPGGCKHQGSAGGILFWRDLMPFFDGGSYWYTLCKSGHGGGGMLEIWGSDRLKIDGLRVPLVECPSSPLPHLVFYPDLTPNWNQPGNVWLEAGDYTGVCGSADGVHRRTIPGGDTVVAFTGIFNDVFDENYPNGEMSGGDTKGRGPVLMAEVVDGLSKTMAIVETSGLRKLIRNPQSKTDVAIAAPNLSDDSRDAGFSDSWGRGSSTWLSGPGPAWWRSSCGLTTIKYRPGTASNLTPGTGVCGPNTPINSAHGEGGNVLMADGSVRYFHSDMDINVLKNLADRDDRNPVSVKDL